MILIADSGSTKTEWCIADEGISKKRIITAGTNPYFQTPEEISDEINNVLLPALKGFNITAVYFYGAGCAFPEKKQIIINAIHSALQVPVEVFSDLMAAVHALCGFQPCIACILGTGSNSCLFDGVEIIEHISPLGFILGDEGSGANLGKILVGDCLKHRIPEPIIEKFLQKYKLTPQQILEHVYKQPFPNRFLASLSPFLLENIKEQPIYNIVHASFQNFFVRNVMYYKGADVLPIHFTGSIAFNYQDVLRDVALSLDLNIGTITQSPMEELILYHTNV